MRYLGGGYFDEWGRDGDATDDVEMDEVFDGRYWLGRLGRRGRYAIPAWARCRSGSATERPCRRVRSTTRCRTGMWLNEASGNEGATLERAYRLAALVIWPRRATVGPPRRRSHRRRRGMGGGPDRRRQTGLGHAADFPSDRCLADAVRALEEAGPGQSGRCGMLSLLRSPRRRRALPAVSPGGPCGTLRRWRERDADGNPRGNRTRWFQGVSGGTREHAPLCATRCPARADAARGGVTGFRVAGHASRRRGGGACLVARGARGGHGDRRFAVARYTAQGDNRQGPARPVRPGLAAWARRARRQPPPPRSSSARGRSRRREPSPRR